MEGQTTFCEDADVYIKEMEELISELTHEEKSDVLLKRVKYWYWSAIDWRNSYECINEKRRGKMKRNKRCIVYPMGALSWEEILETVELLKYEGANPEIVNHNGFWNVEADVSKAAIERIDWEHYIFCESMYQWAEVTCELMEEDRLSISELWNAEADVAEGVV